MSSDPVPNEPVSSEPVRSEPAPEWDPGDLTGLEVSAQAFIRTVDALTSEELAAPSLLPGWTRAHVVAHVALNGFALAGVLDGLVHDQPVAMYESDEQRDAQIEELAEAEPSELREQHLAATTAFADAVEALQDEHWSGHIDRLPGRTRLARCDRRTDEAARGGGPSRRPRHVVHPGGLAP